MGMTVVATFMNLPEAQVAASALEFGGLHPLVMDQGWGSVLWIEQAALQGFRLGVPPDEVADAVAFFRALPPQRKVHMRPRSRIAVAQSNWWRVAAAILGLGLSPVFGWLAVGFRPRRYRRASFLSGGPLVAAVALVIVVAFIVIAIDLLARLPLSVWIASPLFIAALFVAVTGRRQTPPEA